VRILIYAAAARMGGARAHLVGVAPELAALAPDDRVLLLAQPDVISELDRLPSTWTMLPDRIRGPFRRLAWEQARLPRLARRWGADVLLSFGSFIPLRGTCPAVLEAGNALPFTPAFWRLVRRAPPRRQAAERARWLLLRASLRAATRVLAPTHAMRRDVLARLPWLSERLDVALWGVAPFFFHQRWSAPPGQTVLGVSKHGINKEFDVLVQAVAHLAPTQPALRLLLTGTPDESTWSRRSASLADRLGVADRVTWAGDVPNRHVPGLVRSARALVFPTWCESFGLPLAEALAMGAPAVAGDISACREVGGEAARYYRSGDALSLATCLHDMLSDRAVTSGLACQARRRGERFTWRNNAIHVRRTLERAASA
jgi:glycosyltransferase involved in cell wall biosynthesis